MDVRVDALAWEPPDGEPGGLLHGRVWLDGVELENVVGVTVCFSGGDLATVSVRFALSSLELNVLDGHEWRAAGGFVS